MTTVNLGDQVLYKLSASDVTALQDRQAEFDRILSAADDGVIRQPVGNPPYAGHQYPACVVNSIDSTHKNLMVFLDSQDLPTFWAPSRLEGTADGTWAAS